MGGFLKKKKKDTLIFLVAGKKTLSQPKVFCFLVDDRQAQGKRKKRRKKGKKKGKLPFRCQKGRAERQGELSMRGAAGSTPPARARPPPAATQK